MALLNPPSPESSERINLPSEKKSNSTESLLISAGFLLNAQTIAPVSLAGIVLPTVRSISLSAVPDGTVLPVPAMDALTGHAAVSTNISTARRMPTVTTVPLSSIPASVNLTVQEAKKLAAIIAPLLKQGHSPYRIVASHPELGICEKTLYNYIEGGVFREISDISVLDLRRQVSRKIPKKLSKGFKKRIDRHYLQGRFYKNYQEYVSEHPEVFVTQMDTIYNNVSDGPFIQTFFFLRPRILFGILHERNFSCHEAGRGPSGIHPWPGSIPKICPCPAH